MKTLKEIAAVMVAAMALACILALTMPQAKAVSADASDSSGQALKRDLIKPKGRGA